MAEEEKKKKPSDEGARTLAEILIGLIVLLALINGPLQNFRQGGLSGLSSKLNPINYLAPERPLSSFLEGYRSLDGEMIGFNKESAILDEPAGRPIASVGPGDQTTIVGNPIFKNGVRYWPVLLSLGGTGFVAEDSLTNADGGPFDAGGTPVGAEVSASRDAKVYDRPGGREVGQEKRGERGVIVGGPESFDGERYWRVLFEDGTEGFAAESDLAVSGNRFVPRIISFLKYLSYALSILFLTGIIYSAIRISQLRSAEAPKYSIAKPMVVPIEEKVDPRWKRITDHLDSENPSDWRLAILEADIILDEMLKRMGYHGETIGDRLRSVEKSDFTAIDLAWEAHKVRNLIAHEGSDYLITQREAKRIIGLYQKVFEEFHMDTRE